MRRRRVIATSATPSTIAPPASHDVLPVSEPVAGNPAPRFSVVVVAGRTVDVGAGIVVVVVSSTSSSSRPRWRHTSRSGRGLRPIERRSRNTGAGKPFETTAYDEPPPPPDSPDSCTCCSSGSYGDPLAPPPNQPPPPPASDPFGPDRAFTRAPNPALAGSVTPNRIAPDAPAWSACHPHQRRPRPVTAGREAARTTAVEHITLRRRDGRHQFALVQCGDERAGPAATAGDDEAGRQCSTSRADIRPTAAAAGSAAVGSAPAAVVTTGGKATPAHALQAGSAHVDVEHLPGRDRHDRRRTRPPRPPADNGSPRQRPDASTGPKGSRGEMLPPARTEGIDDGDRVTGRNGELLGQHPRG